MFMKKPSSAVRLDELNVMLVDASKFTRKLVRPLLYAMGFRKFTEASNGKEALEELRHKPADLIITGWEMSPVGGLEFIKTLRNAPKSPCPGVDVIILTGNTERKNVLAARDAGMTEFLAKPLTADKLYARVMSVLRYPRPFVEEGGYKGPCRRRTFPGGYEGNERRGGDEIVFE